MAVLLFHLDFAGFGGGFVGVDIFFVISGFLITGLIRRECEAGTFSFADFYVRRARRILPALFATVLVTFIAGAFLMAPVAFSDLASSAIAAVLSVSNITFWLDSGYFSSSKWMKPLLHTWSLGVEEQFYLLWPAAIVLLLMRGNRLAVPVFVGALGVASLALAELGLFLYETAAFFLLPFRVCEFAIGAVLVWLPPLAYRRPWMPEAGFVTGLSAIIVAIVTFDADMRFPGAAAMLPCSGAALCIYFGRTVTARFALANPLFVGVGKISYSLYLVHWPIIVYTKYFLLRDLSIPETLFALLASLALALMLYAFVERPFRFRGQTRPVRPIFASAAALAVASVIAAPAFSAWDTDGWTWRIGDRAAYLESDDENAALQESLQCKGRRCETTGNPDHPKVYVIGDSHARTLYAGLKLEFPDINFVVFSPPACALYSTRYFVERSSRHREPCRMARPSIFAEVAAAPAPVIIFQHWRIYRAAEHAPLKHAGKSLRLPDSHRFAVFVAEQLAHLKADLGVPEIIAIGGVPIFGAQGSPEDCTLRPLQESLCATSPRQSRTNRTHANFNEAIRRNHAGHFVDPFEHLCDRNACRNVDENGRSLYSDSSHLSIAGSRLLISSIRATLTGALSRSRNLKTIPARSSNQTDRKVQ